MEGYTRNWGEKSFLERGYVWVGDGVKGRLPFEFVSNLNFVSNANIVSFLTIF